MNNLETVTLNIENFNIIEGFKLPYYTELVVLVEEVVPTANGNWKNMLKFDFNNKTKIVKIFSERYEIISNDIEVTYRYNKFELRKRIINNLLKPIK
jgi:hypothetical protein